ncbi:hypothetical protein Pfo_017447 [Paulownia fortunei]|nr:hypothetical protein Pfo_017447 [Paulownia fortunei]
MAIKIRKVSGGGIGAVILLGGALTTAALASAFLLRQKGRSSSKDRRRHHQNTPPPAVNELNNQNEQDEAKTGLQFILLDTSSHVQKHLRGIWNCSEATKEVESDNDTTLFVSTQSLTLDKKAGTEINGGIPGAVSDNEASEEIFCSIGPKNLKTTPFLMNLL